MTCLAPVAVTLDPRYYWNDTGVDIPDGAIINIVASGGVDWATGFGDPVSGPDGDGGAAPEGDTGYGVYPCPGLAVHSLCGQINSGVAFQLGSSSTVTLPSLGGRLFLTINDDKLSDNSGSWAVSIEVCPWVRRVATPGVRVRVAASAAVRLPIASGQGVRLWIHQDD